MLPEVSVNPMIAEKLFQVRRDELMREFQDVRLLGAAYPARPGFAARTRIWFARLFGAGKRIEQRAMASSQPSIDYAIKLAA